MLNLHLSQHLQDMSTHVVDIVCFFLLIKPLCGHVIALCVHFTVHVQESSLMNHPECGIPTSPQDEL